jgi:monoamine oxidase
LRRTITQFVQGYDAADPAAASTLALRDEWLDETGRQARIAGGYGALMDYLAGELAKQRGDIRFAHVVSAIDVDETGVTVRTKDGNAARASAVILTVPLPLLLGVELPLPLRDKAALAVADIGFGNVVKILLRFNSKWWEGKSDVPDDLSFITSNAPVPTWWTQYPAAHAVLTGWYAGPRAANAAALGERGLIDHIAQRDLRGAARTPASRTDGRTRHRLGRRSVRARRL